MTPPSASLDRFFDALSCEAQLDLLSGICSGHRTATALGDALGLPSAIACRRIARLEAARLITRRRVGRHVILRLSVAAVDEARSWLQPLRRDAADAPATPLASREHRLKLAALLRRPALRNLLTAIGADDGLTQAAAARACALDQPRASRGLAHLREAGLITVRRCGKAKLHSLDLDGLERVGRWLDVLREVAAAQASPSGGALPASVTTSKPRRPSRAPLTAPPGDQRPTSQPTSTDF